MLPKLFSGSTYKGVPFVHHRMQCALSCPPLFRAWLYSDTGNMQHLEQAGDGTPGSASQDTYEMLLVEREAILCLKGFFDGATLGKVTDEIIIAALTLALHMPEQTHIQGLRHLVEARGGFGKLEMPGLKQAVSLFDIMVASKCLARPFWPLPTHLHQEEVEELLGQILQGYSQKNGSPHPNLSFILPQQIWLEFSAIQGYSTLLEKHSQGYLPGLDLEYVLEFRNMIQHRVMSLPTTEEMRHNLQSVPPTYEALRLGLIAYSLLVLFPISPVTEPHLRLAHLLRYELKLTEVNLEIWMPMVELLIWVLMIGGISAFGTIHRPWYVEQIQWLTGVIGVESWEQLKEIMSSILWLDSLCNAEGLKLWGEVQASDQYLKDESGIAVP
ncbi:hypothetical protein BDV12DRAFT_202685 [Aspergillus spectabilis]